MEKNEYVGRSFITLFTESRSLSGDALETHIKRFSKFCHERYTDYIETTTEMGIEFLRVGYVIVQSTLHVQSCQEL